jgi:signal peptidase II
MRSGTAAGALSGRSDPRWVTLFLLVLLVALVDQLTKAMVRASLEPGEQAVVLGTVPVHHVQNPGIAGGGLQGSALPLGLLAIGLVAWIHAYFVRTRGFTLWLLVGFGLLLGGGIGNLVDRLRMGWVTDFIRSEDRAYNLADVAIFAGGMLVLVALAVSLLLGRHPARDQASGATGD